jgi:glycosyltransferase involved in cell wall biosynthesis
MARVCVIRAHHYPRDTRVLREVGALVEAGHDVDVICLREPGEPARETRARLRVWRLPLRHAAGAGAGRLLAEYAASFTLSAALASVLHLRRRFDLVQVNSVPDALVFAALVPKLAGARVLLDLQEAMPEFFATRFGAPGHPAVRVLERIEQAAIRFADAAITPSPQLRQAFVGRGADGRAISVVMDGSDERVFDPARHPPTSSADGRFVLVSHGTMEPQYGLDTAIAAVASLRDEIPGLRLELFAGQRVLQRRLRAGRRAGGGDRGR